MSSWARTSEKSTYPNSPKSTSSGNKFTGKQGEQVVWVQQAKFLQAPQRILFETKPERPDIGLCPQGTPEDATSGHTETKVPDGFKGWAMAGTSSLIYCAATGCSSSRCGVTPKQLIPSTGSRNTAIWSAEKCYRAQPGMGGDITYIKTDEGYNYLSLVTDKFSRKIVGYDLSESLKAEDYQGITNGYRTKRKSTGFDPSFRPWPSILQPRVPTDTTRPSNPTQHDWTIRSIWKCFGRENERILKTEFLLESGFPTSSLARLAIEEAVDTHNSIRPHLSLNMKTPQEVHQNKTPTTKAVGIK